MRFIDNASMPGPRLALAALLAAALAACSSRAPVAPPPPAAAPAPAPAPAARPAPGTGAAAAAGSATAAANAAAAAAAQAGRRPLPPPRLPASARTMDDLRVAFARRLVEANPNGTYLGQVVQPLLAIPVLEVELRADGQVAAVKVLRPPSQAKDTVQLAIDAVHRAAPFGDVSRVPKPWKFTEVFLFNDDRKFKPRTLDQ